MKFSILDIFNAPCISNGTFILICFVTSYLLEPNFVFLCVGDALGRPTKLHLRVNLSLLLMMSSVSENRFEPDRIFRNGVAVMQSQFFQVKC